MRTFRSFAAPAASPSLHGLKQAQHPKTCLTTVQHGAHLDMRKRPFIVLPAGNRTMSQIECIKLKPCIEVRVVTVNWRRQSRH